ncbi:hypothetical protein OG885_09835 [Streptomyces sp. NBC_00028]|uniref:hypothetical protein n=1 Tax=Streptomyces sp. NBC_00028 TaxID=2975624 RepID=UPI003248DB9B
MPLLLALAAEASVGAIGWAAVGLPHLGVLAAQSAGLDLASGLWVDEPGRQWVQVVATLAEVVPVVLVGRLGPVPGQVARRLAAVLRRSGSVLLAAESWEGAAVRMNVVSSVWDGIGEGHGLLGGRRVQVMAVGRGASAVPRYAQMLLPGPDGRVALVRTDTAATGTSKALTAVGSEGWPALRVAG